jgi:hypothetical protein
MSPDTHALTGDVKGDGEYASCDFRGLEDGGSGSGDGYIDRPKNGRGHVEEEGNLKETYRRR